MMDSFEWNKVLGAILGTTLLIVAVNILVDTVTEVPAPHETAITIAGVQEEGAPGAQPAAPQVEQRPDWGTALAAADVAAGEKIHQRCLQCHDFTKGGPNKIGPNLFGVVGAKRAHAAGFAYSPAIQNAGGTWGYDELYDFIHNPRGVFPATKMTFAGLSRQQDLVNLIAWMRQQSDSPLPIPPPNPAAAPAPAPAGEAPAGGTPPATAGEPAQPTPAPAPATPGH